MRHKSDEFSHKKNQMKKKSIPLADKLSKFFKCEI
jgi:hypothetical protein